MAATFDALTPEQCRRARELLGWSMLDLAEAARVRMVPIIRLEDGKLPRPDARTARIRRALEAAGIGFTDHGDVRLRGPATAEVAILPGPLPRGAP